MVRESEKKRSKEVKKIEEKLTKGRKKANKREEKYREGEGRFEYLVFPRLMKAATQCRATSR